MKPILRLRMPAEFVFPHGRKVQAFEDQSAAVRLVKSAKNLQQGGLARAGGPDHRGHLPSGNSQLDAPQDLYRAGAAAK